MMITQIIILSFCVTQFYRHTYNEIIKRTSIGRLGLFKLIDKANYKKLEKDGSFKK